MGGKEECPVRYTLDRLKVGRDGNALVQRHKSVNEDLPHACKAEQTTFGQRVEGRMPQDCNRRACDELAPSGLNKASVVRSDLRNDGLVHRDLVARLLVGRGACHHRNLVREC